MSNLFTSTIGRKLIMSITGVFLILFLLFHMSMNIVAIFSTEAYNMICEFLGANWYAVAATLILAGGFVIHILYALCLSIYNMKARGSIRYAETAKLKGVTWASKNMLVLGVIVVGFLGLHLYNFWYKMMFAEIIGNHNIGEFGPTDGSAYIADLFSNPIYCVIYLVWLVALWFHLTHGFWSALQTIGWNNQIWLKRWKCVSNILATIIFLGFAAVVVVFYLRSLGCCCGVC